MEQISASVIFIMFISIVKCDIVKIHKQLKVYVGRSVYVDPRNDFSVEAEAGHKCSITVLENIRKPKIGQLEPRLFSCKFEVMSVKYVHFGADFPFDDYIPLQIKYSSMNLTKIFPAIIKIKVIQKPHNSVKFGKSLLVAKIGGISKSIDRNNVQFLVPLQRNN